MTFSLISCFTFVLGVAVAIPSSAHASRSKPKCTDVSSATKSVNRYETKLAESKAWMAAATNMCTNPTATPTPGVECKTTQQPRGPKLENGVCFQYTETYFTCEKDFNAFSTSGTEVTFRGKSGSKWQINYRAPGNFPPCPAR